MQSVLIGFMFFSIDFSKHSKQLILRRVLPCSPDVYVVISAYIEVIEKLIADKEHVVSLLGPSGVGKSFSLAALYYMV